MSKLDTQVFKEISCKFRFGISDLYIHKHRFETNNHLLCSLCHEKEENECHILIRCQAVSDLREKYLVRHAQLHRYFVCTFYRNRRANHRKVLAAYLYHVMKRREDAIL